LSQAIRYTETLEAAYSALAQAPLQSQNCATIRQGYRRRNVEPHFIYCRQTACGIAVIRILYQRMDQVRRLRPQPRRLAADFLAWIFAQFAASSSTSRTPEVETNEQ